MRVYLDDDARGTGYDVILWIEEAVALRGFKPPVLRVHSANSAAWARMEAGIAQIERLGRGVRADAPKAVTQKTASFPIAILSSSWRAQVTADERSRKFKTAVEC